MRKPFSGLEDKPIALEEEAYTQEKLKVELPTQSMSLHDCFKYMDEMIRIRRIKWHRGFAYDEGHLGALSKVTGVEKVHPDILEFYKKFGSFDVTDISMFESVVTFHWALRAYQNRVNLENGAAIKHARSKWKKSYWPFTADISYWIDLETSAVVELVRGDYEEIKEVINIDASLKTFLEDWLRKANA